METIERCRALVSAINTASEKCGATEAQTSWISDDGGVLYQGELADSVSIDAAFLNRLRGDRQKFTGEPLELRRERFGAGLPARLVMAWLANPYGWRPTRLWRMLLGRRKLDWSVAAFARATRGVPPSRWCRMPPDSGGVTIGPYLVNRESAAYQERLAILHRSGLIDRLAAKSEPLILEIGGGFGALALNLKRILPHATYVIVDLPGSLVHAACWLAQWAPGTPVEICAGGTLPNANFILVPHRALEIIEFPPIDLAINTLSFAEMPPEEVARYAAFVASHLAANGMLFEQNFPNRHLEGASFCECGSVLARYFHTREIVRGGYWRGEPSLWSVPVAMS